MPGYRRLQRLTPAACLAAVDAWLLKELRLKSLEKQIISVDNKLWLEFLQLQDDQGIDDEQDIIPAVRGLLWDRIPDDLEGRLTNDVLVVHLHESDPTPVVSKVGNVTTVETRPSWQSLAVYATPDSVVREHPPSL
jgi:hypothetical protein